MTVHRYKLTNAVADLIISINGACIFGGYVRDRIRHDHVAQQYYSHPELDNIGDRADIKKLYDDPEFLPELKDRFLVSQDIDCFMKTSDIEVFEKKLKDARLRVIRKKQLNILEYLTVHDPDLRLTCFDVGFDMNNLLNSMLPYEIRSLNIRIDVVHIESIQNKDPPFGNIDYECNALIIDSSKQIRLCTQLPYLTAMIDPLARFEYLQKIIKNIQQQTTKVVGKNIQRHRTHKMMSKGYTLISSNNKYVLSQNVDQEEVCTLCLDKIDKAYKLKRTCCNASYHNHCFQSMVTHENFNRSCPNCRDHMNYIETKDCISMTAVRPDSSDDE